MGFNFSQFRKIFSTGIKISVLTILLAFSSNVSAQIVFVDATATGTSDGASWANAMTDLQAAIDAAATVSSVSNPIQVWVKAGTYKPTTGVDRTLNFELKSYVEIYGGFAGAETALSQRAITANPTVISGDLGTLGDETDNSYTLFSLEASFSGPIIINGLTLSDIYDPSNVGGIGIIANNATSSPSEIDFSLCHFENNIARFGSVVGFIPYPVKFTSCKFVDNGNASSNTTVWSTNQLEIYNSVFIGNYNPVFRQTGNLILVNSTFANNLGNAIVLQSQPSGISALIDNNVLWNNSGTDIFVDGSNSSSSTSGANNIVQDGFTEGTNTIIMDPQFVDLPNGDFRITHCSPAVDQGGNSFLPSSITEDANGDPRLFNTTIDLGAYESQVAPLFFSAVEVGNAKCNKGSSGQISVNGGGGTGAPITYGLDGVNFSSNAIFENLSAGTYTVYLTDGVCVYSEDFTVTEPTEIDISLSVTSGTSSNTLDVTASGGAGLFQYSTDGTNYQSSGTFNITNGQITAYVRDANNCVETKTISVSADGRVVVFIDPLATGSGDGSSWADAYTDLQTAINAAGNSVGALGEAEVWVKSASYYPVAQSSTDRSQTIQLRNNVLVYGGFLGTETQRSQRNIKSNLTILSGDIGVPNDSTDNSYGIVTAGADITNFATLDGFQLEGAFSLGVEVTNGAVHLIGDVGEVNIKNCTFLYNLANQGACIRVAGVTNSTSKVSVESSRFFTNGFYATSTYVGSAIYVKNDISIFNSMFIKNNSGVGGVFYIGSAGQLDVVNNTFYENGAGKIDGGPVLFDATFGTNVSWHNNINWSEVGFGAPIILSPSTTFANGNNVSSQQLNGPKTSTDDPQFFDETLYDLRVKHCSPAVDAGDDTKLPSGASVDLSGNPRQFSTVDIGAYENQITPISISLISKTDVSCNGLSDGEIVITAAGGTGTTLEYSIDGSPFSSVTTFSGLAAGNYEVYISDPGNGCVVTQSYSILEPDALAVTGASADISCNGLTDGVISGSVSGGTAPYQIFLSGTLMESGVTSNFTIDNLPAATYSLSVTDENGCNVSATSSLTITEPAVLSGSTAAVDVLCNGGATGEITVTPTGGISPYEYSTDGTNFQTGNVFSSLPADAYTVTIRDSNGCEVLVNESVAQPSALSTIAVSATNVSCFGDSDGSFAFGGSGGTLPYQYSLDGVNFQASELWENQSAGNYTITIMDANGCTTTASWIVTEPDELTAVLTETGTSSCGLSDGSVLVTPSGGTGPYSFVLDGGAPQTGSTTTFSGLSAGTYDINIQDAAGCLLDITANIQDPVASTVSVTVTDVLCFGEATGSVNVTVSGGTSPIEYSIDGSTFQMSNVFDNLTAGGYTLTVKEANGCTQSSSITISEPSEFVKSVAKQNISCNGGSDGELIVTVTGGTPPYTYSLDGITYQSSATFSGLTAQSQNYLIRIKDSNDCETTVEAGLTEPDELTLIDDDKTNPVSCIGASDGELGVVEAGGTAPFEFSIDGTNYGAAKEFQGLEAGTYSITVRDGNQCTATTSITVGQPDEIAASITVSGTTSCAGSDGIIELTTVTGGNGPYEYSLDNTTFQTSNIFSGLMAGTYDVYINDDNGCELVESATIVDPQLTVTISTTEPLCFGDASGAFTVNVVGGASGLEYSIDGTNFQTSNVFSNLSAGQYSVDIKHGGGCTQRVPATVSEPTELTVSSTGVNPLCNGDDNGSIATSASGGTGNLTYSLDGTNFSSESSFDELVAGSYTVTVKDENGCLGTADVTLSQPDALSVTVIQTDRSFSITATGGTAPYEYSSDGTTFQSADTFTDLDPGNYTFRVKDANGCSIDSDEFSIVLGLEGKENEMRVYPNPVTEYFLIESLEVEDVEVYDVNGKRQKTTKSGRSVDVSHLAKGTYLIHMKDDKGEVISINRILKIN